MARKTIVRHTDGSLSTRTSKTRFYSHAVVVERSRESLIADAEENVQRHLGYFAQTEAFLAKFAPEDVVEERRPLSFGGEYVNLSAHGQWIGAYVSPREEAPSFEDLKANQDAVRVAQYDRVEALEAKLAVVAAKTGPEFYVVRWSSRADLATKAATGEFANLVREGVKVYVVECEEA